MSLLEKYIGKEVVCRTLQWTYTGTLRQVAPAELLIENAVCVFESGPWTQFCSGGEPRSAEAFPNEAVIPRIGTEVSPRGPKRESE
ncbi:MAG: hypothetical protein GY871_04515 [Actinomycetales bacterium]|nr:hypothetical protein [Actinomycetales bacterium]